MASDYERTGLARHSVPESFGEAIAALGGQAIGARISYGVEVAPDARVSPGINISYAPPASDAF